ncbi:hypothetical protein [Nonomuraea jabiensis]|uniref:hypothetical protein n=1 Tax=Nonomuraea jabiensis TaxID=882448 RepID=UPI003D7573BB
MTVTTETIVGEHTVDGVNVLVQRTTWRGQDGASYDVLYASTSSEVRDIENEDAFDHYPTEEEIRALLRAHRPEIWLCPGCHAPVDTTDYGNVSDHVRDCDQVDGAGRAI